MKVGIKILLRHGVKDSQGAAVANALETMGFEGVEDVQIGKYIVVSMKEDTVESRKTIENMCDKVKFGYKKVDFFCEPAIITILKQRKRSAL